MSLEIFPYLTLFTLHKSLVNRKNWTCRELYDVLKKKKR